MIFFILSPEVPNVYRYYFRNASRIAYDARRLRENLAIIKENPKLRESYYQLGLNEDGTMTKGVFLRELSSRNAECILTYFDDSRNPIEDGLKGNYLADGYMVIIPGKMPNSIIISDFVVFQTGIGRGTEQYLALEEYIRGRYPEVKTLCGVCPFKDAQAFWKKMGFVFDGKEKKLGLNVKRL